MHKIFCIRGRRFFVVFCFFDWQTHSSVTRTLILTPRPWNSEKEVMRKVLIPNHLVGFAILSKYSVQINGILHRIEHSLVIPRDLVRYFDGAVVVVDVLLEIPTQSGNIRTRRCIVSKCNVDWGSNVDHNTHKWKWYEICSLNVPN